MGLQQFFSVKKWVESRFNRSTCTTNGRQSSKKETGFVPMAVLYDEARAYKPKSASGMHAKSH